MANYIDGFVFPIKKVHLNTYKDLTEKIAEIWKEHGALAYYEFVGDDLTLEGTKSFIDALSTTDDEVIIYGWVVFPSKEVRDLANKKVPTDQRMSDLAAPLMDPKNLIFDASRMIYGGFKPFIHVE